MKSQSRMSINILAYYAAFIFLGLTMAATGPLLPALTEKYQVILSQISLIFPANSLGYILSSSFGGRLYDRFNGNRILLFSILLSAIMIALIPAIPIFWLVLFVFFVNGLALGGLDIGCNTLLVWDLRENTGPLMNGLHFCFGVGSFLSPLVISRAATALGQPIRSYWFLALAALPAILLLNRRPGPQIPPPVQPQRPSQANTNSILILALSFFFFLHVGAELAFGNWVYSYALATQLGSTITAAYLTSAFWAAITIGRLLAIPIAMRVKPAAMLIGSLIGGVFSILVILIWPGSQIAIWISAIGLGLSIATLYPSSLTFAGDSMTLTGRITGYMLVGGSLGGMALPWLIGQLFQPVGPQSAMIVIAVAMIAALLVFALLLRYANRRQAVEVQPRTMTT